MSITYASTCCWFVCNPSHRLLNQQFQIGNADIVNVKSLLQAIVWEIEIGQHILWHSATALFFLGILFVPPDSSSNIRNYRLFRPINLECDTTNDRKTECTSCVCNFFFVDKTSATCFVIDRDQHQTPKPATA